MTPSKQPAPDDLARAIQAGLAQEAEHPDDQDEAFLRRARSIGPEDRLLPPDDEED